jgi:hypothetical protein
MDQRAHRIQCLFTEAASEQAAAAGIELHFPFDASQGLPQVGDFLGFASTTGARSRFVVREREFLWDGDELASGPSVVLLMLDLPDRQWGETGAEHLPSEIIEKIAGK